MPKPHMSEMYFLGKNLMYGKTANFLSRLFQKARKLFSLPGSFLKLKLTKDGISLNLNQVGTLLNIGNDNFSNALVNIKTNLERAGRIRYYFGCEFFFYRKLQVANLWISRVYDENSVDNKRNRNSWHYADLRLQRGF